MPRRCSTEVTALAYDQWRARADQRRQAGGSPHRHGLGQAGDEDGRDFRSARYQVDGAAGLLAELSRRAASAAFPVTTNPCGEIALHVTGGYCVIADFAPLLACPVPLDDVRRARAPDEVAALWDARVEDSVRLGVRFLMRANRMDALYGEEVARTNRMGIGPTGLHEWAWMRFGLAFNDLLDGAKSAPFWAKLERSRTPPRMRPTPTPTTRPGAPGHGHDGEAGRHHQQAVRADRGRPSAGAAPVSALGAVQGHAGCGVRRVGRRVPIRCWRNMPRAAIRCAR